MDPYREFDSEDRPPHHFRHHHHHQPPPPPPPEDPLCEENYPEPPRFPRHEGMHLHPHKVADEYVPADPYPAEEKYAQTATPEQPVTPELPPGQLVRVFCKGNPSFNLAVVHNSVVMVPANSEDENQQWVKDASFGMRIKDNYGHSAFSLVNKATRKLLKHAKEKGQQVLLTEYRPDIRDDDILWTESQDFGEGFKTVRSASDTLLNLTIFEGNKKIRNGSALVLDTWHKGDHQLWKLFPL